MNKSIKKALMTAAATATMATAFIGFSSVSASAMDVVPCPGTTHSEFVEVTAHIQGDDGNVGHPCYANGGEYDYPAGVNWVVTDIWTGNNRVQYFADGRWQPDQPFDKNTDHDLGAGVVVQKLRIV